MEFHSQQTVKQLSGPVSLYYLKPPPQRPELPLLLLFGDIHESEEGVCDPCVCNDDSKECCRRIDDPLFLKQIDAIAEQYPVDFFTESTPDRQQSDPNGGILFYRLIDQTIKGCYDVGSRSTPAYINKCPTQSIRWHHADSRFMKTKVEGYLNYILAYTEYVNDVCARHSNLPTRIPYLDCFDPAVPNKNLALRNRSVPYIHGYLSILRKEMPLADKVNAIVDHLIGFLDEFAPQRQSTILKQHAKIQHVDLQSMEVWKSYLIRRMMEEGNHVSAFETIERYAKTTRGDPDRMYERLMDFYMSAIKCVKSRIRSMAGTAFPSDLKEYADILCDINMCIRNITLFFNGLLVDLYMMMRMFGTPKDNDPALLAIGYFGNTHVMNMAKGLQEPPFSYEMVYAHAFEGNVNHANRCLTFPGSAIPLVRDVEHLAQQRYRNAGRPMRYLNVLQRERAGREKKGGRRTRRQRCIRTHRKTR